MKNGILFFFNMGKITTVARIALAPFALMIWRSWGQVFWFFFFIALFALALLISFVPAPSDRGVMLALERARQDFDMLIRSKCSTGNSDSATKLDGYRVKGKMILKRQKGTKVIYPHPAFFAISKAADRQYWFFVSCSSLTNEKPPLTFCCPIKSPDYELSIEGDSDDFQKVAYLTLKCELFPEGESFVVDRNYRIREFLAQIEAAKK